jgi:hypothetical protein
VTVSETQERVIQLAREHQELEGRQREIAAELSSLKAGEWNGWYRQEARVLPAIIRPEHHGSTRQWAVYEVGEGYRGVLQGAVTIPEGRFIGVDEDGRGILPDAAWNAVYQSEVDALRGAIAYCLYQLHEWETKRNNLAIKLREVRE